MKMSIKSTLIKKMPLFIASLLFNLAWFLALLGGNDAIPFLMLGLLAYFYFLPQSIGPVFLMAFIGISGDSLLASQEILVFPKMTLPLWLLMLWLCFATYVWAIRSYILSWPLIWLLIITPLGGLICYLAGERLGAVEILAPLSSQYAFIFLAWLIYTVLFYSVLCYLKKVDT